MFQRKFIPILRSSNSLPKIPLSRRIMNDKFTVLSYNMLSPSYMWPQVYTYVPDQYKDWNYRHTLLELELLDKYKADIMCVQEMTKRDYIDYWQLKLGTTIGYGSKFIAKSPPKYWERHLLDLDGVAIFYNLQKFDFISSSGIYLNEFLDVFNPEELQYLKEKTLELTDGAGIKIDEKTLFEILSVKNQVSLFVCLKHKETGQVFIIINTHLYWKYDEVKLSQCIIIMRELSKIIDELLQDVRHSKVKIIFAGDLNSTKDSLVVKFLEGQILSHGALNMVNPMRPYFNSSIYNKVPEDFFTNTCYSGKLKGIFDYLWYNDKDLSLTKILRGKEVSDELEALMEFGLPNKDHPSDHIPILTEFQILH
ncbi:RNA exonuclease NDAI_0A08530 [Naumovozyma dairenensis CBS 421]|uniref:Endonuclease/exonuclease/phosphatase domain-containing protein n=1 Tax=Naumovozyma dairenensis (strain ATCC 10597 / BCRC 20456 / CBS 421 / NBRC 0211 / NRRL Y-12639) TaxID=1071378 RepID=G0W5B8_NAUDC|nr:hypothetical protein NDAI_0A08530 [Naumovozyma dairenensis CBS 421]CCD23006.1 hypothetical protein NDAI_0A08530 [Naumovozyma dairenensis CBS 421]